MGFNVNIKRSSYKDRTPKFSQTYTLTGMLSDRCPVVGETLFSESDPHYVSHQNSRLREALQELEKFIGGYMPQASGRNLNSIMIAVPAEKFVGTLQGKRRFEGLKPQDDTPVKNAAYSLKEVIQYALEKGRDIKVS